MVSAGDLAEEHENSIRSTYNLNELKKKMNLPQHVTNVEINSNNVTHRRYIRFDMNYNREHRFGESVPEVERCQTVPTLKIQILKKKKIRAIIILSCEGKNLCLTHLNPHESNKLL